MDDVVGELQRRIANVVRRGVVHSVRSGEIPKARISLDDTTTGWLPVCMGFSGANRADFDLPAVGDPVTLLCEGGELENGRVYPGMNSLAHPAPVATDNEHVTRYGDGTEIRYDRAAHALTVTISQEGTYTLKGKGTLDGDVWITKRLFVEGDIIGLSQVFDLTGTMTQIRTIYNGHTHQGDSGGITGVPKNKM